MRRLLLLSLFALTLSAQSTVPVSSTVALPTNWTGAGAAYTTKIGAWVSFATLINAKGQIYSFTTQDESVLSKKPLTVQTSTRTGLCTVMKNFGPLYLLGCADAGGATTGTNIMGAFAGEGVALLRLGKTNWTVVFSGNYLKASGSQTTYKFGFGRIW